LTKFPEVFRWTYSLFTNHGLRPVLELGSLNDTCHSAITVWLKKYLLSIKGRSCNQTPLVHQDMTKKTTF